MSTGVDDWRDDPDRLWRRTGLGREEYVQKLLAALVSGQPATRWNVEQTPTERGARFLRALHELSGFGPLPDGDVIFVDEFELPSRHDGERAGWPDHAVLTDGLVFLIELKSERQSHRPGQLQHYLDLAAHHHRERERQLLYLTPSSDYAPPAELHGGRYEHLSWRDVGPLIADVWGQGSEPERTIAGRLAWWIEELEAGNALPARDGAIGPVEQPAPFVLEEALAQASELAMAVQDDRSQRALDIAVTDPEDLEELRLEVRTHLDGSGAAPNVRPWIWSAATSGGTALTPAGAATGLELRLSYYIAERNPQP